MDQVGNKTEKERLQEFSDQLIIARQKYSLPEGYCQAMAIFALGRSLKLGLEAIADNLWRIRGSR